MKTVLSRTCFVSNGNGGEESRIVERQRERECVCETACGGDGRIATVIKKDVREIHLVRSNVGLICEINEIPEKR
jgi:hypothetical protein